MNDKGNTQIWTCQLNELQLEVDHLKYKLSITLQMDGDRALLQMIENFQTRLLNTDTALVPFRHELAFDTEPYPTAARDNKIEEYLKKMQAGIDPMKILMKTINSLARADSSHTNLPGC